MSDLAPAVQALLDKSEITELLTRYLRAIDRGDIARLRACYADGATEEHGGIYAGPAQGYIDTIEAALRHPRSVGTHTLSNVLIDIAGDRALSEHYVLALTRVKADGVVRDCLVASRIIDDLERHDGRWLIARRRLRFDWSQELGPRPDRWVGGQLDPANLLHGAKFPDDPIYDGIRTESALSASSGPAS
jgi:ketosteroid isomerase-like protein